MLTLIELKQNTKIMNRCNSNSVAHYFLTYTLRYCGGCWLRTGRSSVHVVVADVVIVVDVVVLVVVVVVINLKCLAV